MEAHEVELEHGLEQMRCPGQEKENVWPGERDVLEEADGAGVPVLAEPLPQEKEVIVVSPDCRVRTDETSRQRRECLVGGLVGMPVFVRELQFAGKRVKQRPER